MTSDITLFVNPAAGRGRGAGAAHPAARVLLGAAQPPGAAQREFHAGQRSSIKIR
ncbi:hypothetical protein [Streptomyces roseoverticillatus]|uniref:Sphingosine kinase n=1 Tax=Streptomyces roseoverticillatus TaxID=66429 RepID=A0ABV3J2G9_9ACTN